MGTEIELRHLRREIKTALEVAVVGLAPVELLNRLASAAGLLEALSELPADCPPALALTPRTVSRARRALSEWHRWEGASLKKAVA